MTNIAMTYNPGKINISVKDPFSALTHFIGILYSAFLTPVIMTRALYHGNDQMTILSVGIFLLSMVLLYTASTIYHSLEISDHCSHILKKIDHCMIFILIAGTYTPVCLIPLRHSMGPKLLTFVWGFALAGILFKLCWINCPKWVSSVIYIGMGWSCIFAIPSLFRILPLSSFLFLLIGGVIYTAGGVIYALKLQAFNTKNPNFGSHEVFHVFVMVGNLFHFLCVWSIL